VAIQLSLRGDFAHRNVGAFPHDVLETASSPIERFAYCHVGIRVISGTSAAHARRASGGIDCGLVLHHHVLTRQRQLDANVQRPMAMAMRRL
jgi:hypothetical protein